MRWIGLALSLAVPSAAAGAESPRPRWSVPLRVEAGAPDVRALGHQSLSIVPVEAWPQLIDAAWGPGAPTADKLRIFDSAWEALDQGYGAFMNLEVDLASLRERYRLEIEGGVSRGRFVAILNHLSRAMKDLHTVIFNREVNTWPVSPGVPLFIVRGWLDNSHFGASVTPLPDDSLLVYRACANHPLGLEPGDVVLGYDGIPWRDLYRTLLDEELPIEMGAAWGSTDESMDHAMLISVGMNWHLFDTIDVVKYSTGETEHLSTGLFRRRTSRCTVWGKEQLLVPGVPMTNGAFTPSDNPYLGSEWHFSRGTGSGYLIDGHEYLAHRSAPIDEEVWLTREDVIAGRDTVVAAAIDWIRRETSRSE